MLDQIIILQHCLRVVQALVDVISSNGWFTPALLAMELSQMFVQALHPSQSFLYQLPHFDKDRIAIAESNFAT
jgi:pre-mRNA-splicing helicase BRR2